MIALSDSHGNNHFQRAQGALGIVLSAVKTKQNKTLPVLQGVYKLK